jgi:hypothetical protein
MLKPFVQEKKEKKEIKDEPSLDFLKVDRSLRPDGFHLADEMGAVVKK